MRQIGNLSGHARATRSFRAKLGMNPTMDDVYKLVEREEAVDGLARVIDEGMRECTKGGVMQSRDLAAYILRKISRNQR